MTGILGGYTTFSLDAAMLYERGAIGQALFYVLGSVVFSILGLFAGLALVRHLA
jgi:CrcB protein